MTPSLPRPARPGRRRAPLARGGWIKRTPIKRGTKPLKHRSKRARAKDGARRECLEVVRERSGGACEMRTPVCTGRMECGHELQKRSQGGSITNPRNVLASCLPCNGWVEDHPAEAHEMGLVIRRGDL